MLKVYLVQMESQPGKKSENLQKAEILVREARPDAGSLILFPEMFDTGYIPQQSESFGDSYSGESIGETPRFLAEISRKTGCTVIGGGMCKKQAGKTNHVGVFSPESDCETAGYDKVHPFFPERENFIAGQDITLSKINDFNVAPSICYDLRFPELYRSAVLRGADLLTVHAAWPAKRREHWETLLKARAIESQAFVAAVNCVTLDGMFSGDSQIIDPWGEILVKASPCKECIVQATLQRNVIQEARETFPFLKNDVFRK
ncbi:MAG: nitrilase [Fibrobacter sp.]|nr:nitrilase [Fibrobacter sp.]